MGHKGQGRELLPPEQVDHRIEYRPAVCEHCRATLDPGSGELVGRHQVAELPPRAVKITEHQSFVCRCSACGKMNRAVIPEAVRSSSIGPRLSGAIGVLSALVHGSRRAVEGIVTDVLGCPIALGSISARERELSDALEGPYGELVNEVSAAKVKCVDETSWYRKSVEESLFVAASHSAAVFRIEKTRNRSSLKKLLRGKLHGVFCTDRAFIYDVLPLSRRGVCWRTSNVTLYGASSVAEPARRSDRAAWTSAVRSLSFGGNSPTARSAARNCRQRLSRCDRRCTKCSNMGRRWASARLRECAAPC